MWEISLRLPEFSLSELLAESVLTKSSGEAATIWHLHWNYGQGIELLPVEQWSLIIWLNHSLLVTLKSLVRIERLNVGRNRQLMLLQKWQKWSVHTDKGSDPSHFFPAPCYVKKRESKFCILGSKGNYELCKSHACVMESRIRGSSHLSPSCLSLLGLHTEHNSSDRQKSWLGILNCDV